MTADEFMRKLKKLGRRTSNRMRYDSRRGVGSHGRLHYGNRFTTIIDPRREIGPGLLRKMCRDLGIDMKDL